MKTPAAIALVILLGGCVNTAVNKPVFKPHPPLGGQPAPFSEAVQVGDMLYLAGKLGTKPGTRELVPGGVEAEARQTMENIRDVLERHGTSLDHVVKATVFLADMKDWPAFNAVYVQYFRNNLPARSALGANGLALGAKVEVEVIAWVPPKK
jgi:reactive intermediate/imine deaminase